MREVDFSDSTHTCFHGFSVTEPESSRIFYCRDSINLVNYITSRVSRQSHSGDIGPAVTSGGVRSKSSAIYLLPAVALSAIYTVGLSFLTSQHLGPPETARVLYPFAFSSLLTGWVRADRRVRGLAVPFEFEVFIYFAWPLFVPYYLIRTRGWIGLLFGAGIWGLFVAPLVTATTLSVFNRH